MTGAENAMGAARPVLASSYLISAPTRSITVFGVA